MSTSQTYGLPGFEVEAETLYGAFAAVAAAYPRHGLLCVPPNPRRAWWPGGIEFTFGQAAAEVARLREAYGAAGYGLGHRVALSLENRPEHYFHLLALNALGASVVALNPDNRHDELLYQLEHAEVDLAVAAPRTHGAVREAALACSAPLSVISEEESPSAVSRPSRGGAPDARTEVCLIYTSGTTGRPKAAIAGNRYVLRMADWFLGHGGLAAYAQGQERIYNPLPLYHLAMGLFTPTVAILSANCAIVTDRFSPSRVWPEIVQSRASVGHFLGLIPALLVAQPETFEEKQHGVRMCMASAVGNETREAFERRFGIVVVENWGMTECPYAIVNSREPRLAGKGALGYPRAGIEVKVADDRGNELPPGEAGELLVRAQGADARDGFFSGYLKDDAATEEAWRGGWFHTGDIMRRDADGALSFIDRKKHIIRRSGVNIAAAEVEACLTAHPEVALAAVIAAPDELRQEEVMACIVPKAGSAADESLARRLMDHALARLTYYKAPGWWLFVDSLPLTGTNKVRKLQLFAPGVDPRRQPGAIDLRWQKKHH